MVSVPAASELLYEGTLILVAWMCSTENEHVRDIYKCFALERWRGTGRGMLSRTSGSAQVRDYAEDALFGSASCRKISEAANGGRHEVARH